MPYSAGIRLPGESASKLGHLSVVQSEWVRSLVAEFESTAPVTGDNGGAVWEQPNLTDVQPLQRVWAVDGSFVSVATEQKPPREVAFVKTALLALDRDRLGTIDKDHPHPLLLQDILTNSAVFHATVFPLKNIKSPLGSNYDAVRHIVSDSIKIDQGGLFFDTLKWLCYRKWLPDAVRSPSFKCPHCDAMVDEGLPADADAASCSNCRKEVLLTDVLGFHLDMNEDSAPDSVASAYMLVMELLMLFTAIRIFWDHDDKRLISDTLFLKDGPLTLRGQYSKLIPSIRSFLQFAKDAGRPICVVGQEKTGAFVDHLNSIVRSAPPHQRGEAPALAVLSHGYVRREVHRSPDLQNPYGLRTNWGEKAYLKVAPGTHMVLSIPTGLYQPDDDFPQRSDLIEIDRILATLPALVSHKFEGALFPIELANGIASMSSYPSARILQRFVEGAK
jgi:hypothetical protein